MVDLSTIHALIIDDDHASVDVITALLDQLGASYTALATSDNIVNSIRALDHQVDVIFLDLEMPVRNGYEVLLDLRDELSVAVPIVAYTAHTAEMVDARDAGFHSCLGKPLSSAKFAAPRAARGGSRPGWRRAA
jgi:two-component system KDP operon response regulator KdpE